MVNVESFTIVNHYTAIDQRDWTRSEMGQEMVFYLSLSKRAKRSQKRAGLTKSRLFLNACCHGEVGIVLGYTGILKANRDSVVLFRRTFKMFEAKRMPAHTNTQTQT